MPGVAGCQFRVAFAHGLSFEVDAVVGRVDEARMALALLLRGGPGAPLSTEFGRWVGYGWMALRLSTNLPAPEKPVQEQCARGSQEAPPHLAHEPKVGLA